MANAEFDIIDHYFKQQKLKRSDVIVDIGDDAAIIEIPQGMQCVIAMDTMNAGIHFLADCPAYDIGYKALAVNLSDLAAMAATPAWSTLSLTMPESDQTWLAEFCRGFFDLADQHQCQLIGGDLTHGPLSISVTVQGLIEPGKALLRSGASAGDLIYVSGDLGGAAFALAQIQQSIDVDIELEQRLQRPIPRINEAKIIAQFASAAIDISDGLAQDLGHILEASKVGATIDVAKIPHCPYISEANADAYALSGGDDFELCFTIPAKLQHQFENVLNQVNCPVNCIGVINSDLGLQILKNNQTILLKNKGYQHF